MPESTSPAPLPPNGGTNANPATPNAAEAATPSPRQIGLTKRQMEAISLTVAIIDVARRPEYAPLIARTIDGSFLTLLEQDIGRLLSFGMAATTAGATGKDAVQEGTDAKAELVLVLREIQAAARLKHLPEHPHLLEKYAIGQDLTASRAVLESISDAMIREAGQERPGAIDTAFLTNAGNKRTAYVGPEATQQTQKGRGMQSRSQRDELFASVVARRKKIQYAADNAWGPKTTTSVQARTDFRIPVNRPYSY